MGSQTLLNIVNDVFSRTDDATVSSNAINNPSRPEVVRVISTLNMGYRTIYKAMYGSLRPKVLQVLNLTTGIATYKLDSRSSVLKSLYVYPVTSPNNLIPQSNILELTQSYGNLNVQGDPQYWYSYNNYMAFYPVPNAAQKMTVTGTIAFNDLSMDTDTTFLPDEHDDLLVKYAIGVEKMFWKDQDASFWMQQWETGLHELRAEALRNAPTILFGVDPYVDDSDGIGLTIQGGA